MSILLFLHHLFISYLRVLYYVNQEKASKINVVTLGCSKNLVDSEKLLGQLKANQLSVVHDSSDADARTVVINTCGFIADAKEESVNTILEHVRAKQEGLIDKVFVMGCLSERYKDMLKTEIPEVDGIYGVNSLDQIVKDLGGNYKKTLWVSVYKLPRTLCLP